MCCGLFVPTQFQFECFASVHRKWSNHSCPKSLHSTTKEPPRLWQCRHIFVNAALEAWSTRFIPCHGLKFTSSCTCTSRHMANSNRCSWDATFFWSLAIVITAVFATSTKTALSWRSWSPVFSKQVFVRGVIYFISDMRPKSGLSSSDGCPSAAPLCRNPQGVAVFRPYFLSIVQDETSLLLENS